MEGAQDPQGDEPDSRVLPQVPGRRGQAQAEAGDQGKTSRPGQAAPGRGRKGSRPRAHERQEAEEEAQEIRGIQRAETKGRIRRVNRPASHYLAGLCPC